MRSSGLALIVIVLLGAMTRARAPQTQPNAIAGQTSGIVPPPQSGPQRVASPSPKPQRQDFPTEIRRNIRDFFDREPTTNQSCESEPHWCVPTESRAGIRFVIAAVPDPVHSHLSLFFDRIIEAIEQGASSKKLDYSFDRAAMPWRYFDRANTPDAADLDSERESFPGLMIFRHEATPPLFVFVVGETPTAGINEEQFNHAVDIIHAIRAGTVVPQSEPEFGILGPTFSGSLYSLQVILNKYRESPNAKGRIFPVYATVMGTLPINSFRIAAPDQVRMAIFEEDSQTIQNALQEFACRLGYQEVAILSEDETAYGSSNLPPPDREPMPCVASGSGGGVLNLSFPRGISQFRSAYSKEVPQQSATGNGNQPQQSNLRLDLQVTGRDDDGIAPYSKDQTALSQEAVMFGIVSELHRNESKIILLRATDPLDELFLARYLRKAYPQARLVVPTPDLLFASGEDGLLNGVLGLNTYPLEPARFNPLCTTPSGGSTLLFTAPSIAAVYNATGALLTRLDKLSAPYSATSEGKLESKKGGARSANVERPQAFGQGATPDMSPCGLSPDLWLSIVSGNTIYPIKTLKQSGSSAFFPMSIDQDRNGESQLDARVPITWVFAYILCLLALCRHAWLSWTGGYVGQWQTEGQFNTSEGTLKKPTRRRALILWLGGIILTTIFSVLASAWTTSPTSQEQLCPDSLVYLPLLGFIVLLSVDFWTRRKEVLLASMFPIVSVGIAVAGRSYASWRAPGMVLWHQRALDLGSGISPTTPLLLVLVAAYLWFWYSFKAEALVDWRRPRLPRQDQLPTLLRQLSEESAGAIRSIICSFSIPWVALVALAAAVCLGLPSLFTDPGHVPIRSLEGRLFDLTYSVILGLAVALFVATLLRLLLVWKQLRSILTALDRFGFSGALERLTGFEWHTIWNPTWSTKNEGYKLISHEIQTIDCLEASLGAKADTEAAVLTQLRGDIKSIFDLRVTLAGILQTKGLSAAARSFALMPDFSKIQEKFAETAGHLITSYLDSSWKSSAAQAGSGASGSQAEKSGMRISVGTAVINVGTVSGPGAPKIDESPLSEKSTRLAEEFVACVYANFLVSVLLRIRGLVFSAVAIYACIVFSTIFYPFEPAPTLSVLAGGLFVFGAVAVGYVYEEMHRDATLSRMTSSGPGKLDSGFWIKFVSAGIVPLVGLLASLFPTVGYFLYSAVEPLLQALR